jgi:hypothetical protein
MKDWDRADTVFLLLLIMAVAVMSYGSEPFWRVLHIDSAIFTVDND